MNNYTKKKTTKLGTTFYLNDQDKYHRLDGPAIEWEDGDKEWYINGLHHRLDGPAIEWSDGDKVWYINGVQYTEKEFQQYIKMQEAKQMLGISK